MAERGREHHYAVVVEWVGNRGVGTADYRAYERSHTINSGEKPPIAGSSDPAFRGDPSKWNPEDLLVASLSACHKLWYLHFCSVNGVTVLNYVDRATGTMVEDRSGGRFKEVTLRPCVTVRATDDVALAERLHEDAHAACFIANSVNFTVRHEPVIVTQTADDESKGAVATTDPTGSGPRGNAI
jgi:organic hydroperoxide reductase OsmC/OhrA